VSTLVAAERSVPRVAAAAQLRRLPEFLGIAVQLALALLVIEQFEIENRTFFHVALLAVGGFLVSAALPVRLRLPCFAALSAASLAVAFGLRDAAALCAVSAALVGLCHLPIALRWRVALLLAVGALLAALRAEAAPVAGMSAALWGRAVWPVFGAMFMFRLALYLHALETESERPTATQAAAYFLMLPNVCFPLFPVVDFTTFRRTHFDRDALEIYQTGARWIARGLVQLLLYRFVYHHLVRDPADVRTLGDLVTFLLATFALYLRVSGQFHLVVGLLHLFGFRLPETHKLYFLSSGFTDFWRRINIYWKDFMMKLVYYPSFFRLRRFGPTVALGGATVLVFVATWLLHSYQWFWLRGGFPITAPDILFWGLLGALVLWAALREARRGRDRSLGARRWSVRLALRVVGTFWVLCVLWSLWSAESVVEWVQIWGAAAHVDAAGLALLGGVLAVHLAVAGRNWSAPTLVAARAPWWHDAARTAALLATVLLVGRTSAYDDVAPRVAAAVASLRGSTLNRHDQALRHKGYYEKLDNVDRVGAPVLDAFAARPADIVGLPATAAWRDRNDLLLGDLRPSMHVSFYRRPLTSNAYGMRDREYALAKPADTWRAAVLGPSHVMGAGVADGETFEARLEERMNGERPAARYARYELLNFGVPAYSLLQEALMLEDRALQFHPDVVIATLYRHVDRTAVEHLATALQRGVPVADDSVRALLARVGLDPARASGEADGVPVPGQLLRRGLGALGVHTRVPWREQQVVLQRHATEINAYALRRIARDARAVGARPLLLLLDQPEPEATWPDVGPLLDEARRAGFLMLDLRDVYDGHDLATLRVFEWDGHPNAAATRLIAERLFQELRRYGATLRLAPDSSLPQTAGTVR
jgi:hypothetical protein